MSRACNVLMTLRSPNASPEFRHLLRRLVAVQLHAGKAHLLRHCGDARRSFVYEDTDRLNPMRQARDDFCRLGRLDSTGARSENEAQSIGPRGHRQLRVVQVRRAADFKPRHIPAHRPSVRRDCLRQQFAQRLAGTGRPHQRLAHEEGIEPRLPQTRNVFTAVDAALGNLQYARRHKLDESRMTWSGRHERYAGRGC